MPSVLKKRRLIQKRRTVSAKKIAALAKTYGIRARQVGLTR
jgi:hypothetical protein